MGIDLFFSNRLETLADKLAGGLDTENRAKENLFEPSLVVVPNPNLKKWLQLTIAKGRPVLMNVDFQYLESGLWGLIEGLDPSPVRPATADHRLMRMLLLRGLGDLDRQTTEYAPLTRYLLNASGQRGPDYAAKLWQLTEKMAGLFEEYEFHRLEMIGRWLSREGRPEGMELCQRNLYLLAGELRERYVKASGGPPVLSLGEYSDTVLRTGAADPPEGRSGRQVHIFGLSQVSRLHLGVIYRLREYYDIFIYTLNPCREFWEDVKTPGEKRWIRKKRAERFRITRAEAEEGELSEEAQGGLLSLWGKPGRENIRLLCQLTDYDFNACFSLEEGETTVLGELQRRILTLPQGKNCVHRVMQDRSLQIFGSPGIHREVETVYNSIIHNLERDETLQLTDIAVLVPEISTYKPVVDSVFNRSPRRISYCLVDSRADIESLYGKAVLSILNLASGRFSRKEVFDLILNPCFMGRWRIGPEEVNVWARWAEALNIFHSFDREEKEKRGYGKSPLYTWKQGLERLRLSRIMAPPDEGGGDGFRHFQGLVPFFDRNTGDVDLVEKFSVIVEKIHREITGLSDLRATGREWKERLLRVCDELIEVPPDLRGEAGVKGSLGEALGDLGIYDDLSEGSSGPTETSLLHTDLVVEFVRSSLAAISGGYGDYLTEGVTVSALQPMRPIPFRIIYVLGMEEGAFPGQAERSSLDLRLQKRRIGDVSLPERNCYLFLETLLSARDKLYIGYRAKDLQKDRLIEPCSVVSQLRRYVEEDILPPGEAFRITQIPLTGTSEQYLAHDALTPASDLMVNYSLADRIALLAEKGELKRVREGVPEDIQREVDSLFPDLQIMGEGAANARRPVEKITLKQLRKFLEDPVSHGVKRHLGLFDEEESLDEITLREDEPFYSVFPVDYELKMTPLLLWLDNYSAAGKTGSMPGDPGKIFDAVYEDMKRKGATPEGAFALVDRRRLREDLLKRADILSGVLTEMESGAGIYRAFVVGEGTGGEIPSSNRLPVERFDPVRLGVTTFDSAGHEVEKEAELHGFLPWIWQGPDKGWNVLAITGSKNPPKSGVLDRYVVESILGWMSCLLSEGAGLIQGHKITIHLVYGEKVITWRWHADQEAVKNYMKGLVSEYLNQERMEWLPMKVVTSIKPQPHMLHEDEIDAAKREEFHAQLCDRYADEESMMVRLARPVIPPDALDRARNRFRIFLPEAKGKSVNRK